MKIKDKINPCKLTSRGLKLEGLKGKLNLENLVLFFLKQFQTGELNFHQLESVKKILLSIFTDNEGKKYIKIKLAMGRKPKQTQKNGRGLKHCCRWKIHECYDS